MESVASVVNSTTSTKEGRLTTALGKSESLKKFQEIVKEYFDHQETQLSEPQYKGGDGSSTTNQHSEETPNLNDVPRHFDKKLSKELYIDVSALIRELSPLMRINHSDQREHNGDKESTEVGCCVFNSPAYVDYTAIILTKFFHSIETPQTLYRTFSNHLLFGKWRDVRFDSLLEEISGILKSAS